jgi:hypothetical protein
MGEFGIAQSMTCPKTDAQRATCRWVGADVVFIRRGPHLNVTGAAELPQQALAPETQAGGEDEPDQ